LRAQKLVNIKLIGDEEETRFGLPSSASLLSAITMKSDNNFIASHRCVKDKVGSGFLVGEMKSETRWPVFA
jgi:hypothetical protein